MATSVRRVGRYEILREVGRGGMARVFLARQIDLDRHVALKELSAFHATDPAFLERFLRESRVAGGLSHPNIVTVHEYFEHDSTPYIAMEYLERGSLRPFVGQVTLAETAGVLEGLLAGLAHAEERGIVHRDLKPENVMVTLEGRVKIADFGIAKAIGEGTSRRFLTLTGTTVGTPAYMAPEQAMGKEIGPWTDVFSVGVMAYELLVGQVPFGDSDTPVALMLRHAHEAIPSPRLIDPTIDPGLERWLMRMLARDVESRIGRSFEAWDELEDQIIRLLGPRWRRDARLAAARHGADAPEPLTPAPFSEEQNSVAAEPEGAGDTAESGFLTFRPRRVVEGGDQAATSNAMGGEAAEAALPPTEDRAAEGASHDGSSASLTPARDGYETFEPRVPAPAGLAQSTDAPSAGSETKSPPPSAGEIAGLRAVKAESVPTVPPKHQRRVTSYQWPSIRTSRHRRRPLIAALLVLALTAAATALVGLTRAGRHASTTVPHVTPPLDSIPRSEERATLVAADESLYLADPRGRVVLLSGGPSTTARSSIADPARPRSLVVTDRQIFIADDESVLVLDRRTQKPVGAVPLRGASMLALAGGSSVAVATHFRRGGRICLVSSEALGPCRNLGFAPAGLGAWASGFFVVDPAGRAVVPFRVVGGRLVPGARILVGRGAHGAPVEHAGKLIVAVNRGVVIIDQHRPRSSRLVHLPTSPSAVLVDRSSGLVFAPLYASARVALIPTRGPRRSVRFVASSTRPVSVASSGGTVYVVGHDVRTTITRLDGRTGRLLGSSPLDALITLGSPRLIAKAVEVGSSTATTTARLRFSSGAFDPQGVVVRDDRIASGRAELEIWQGGVRTRVPTVARDGLRVTVDQHVAHLLVKLIAEPGTFTRLAVRLSSDRRSLTFVLARGPFVVTTTLLTTTTTATTTQSTTSAGTTTQSGTTSNPRIPK